VHPCSRQEQPLRRGEVPTNREATPIAELSGARNESIDHRFSRPLSRPYGDLSLLQKIAGGTLSPSQIYAGSNVGDLAYEGAHEAQAQDPPYGLINKSDALSPDMHATRQTA
jgi:hypothetical protein